MPALEKAPYEPNSSAIHSTTQLQIKALKTTLVALSESPHEAQELETALREHIEQFEVFCVLAAEILGLDQIERASGIQARTQVFAEYRKRIERYAAGKRYRPILHWQSCGLDQQYRRASRTRS